MIAYTTLDVSLGFWVCSLSTVRHDNYPSDWMEIVKSLRINNKSNQSEEKKRRREKHNKDRVENNVNAHRSILCTNEIVKTRIYVEFVLNVVPFDLIKSVLLQLKPHIYGLYEAIECLKQTHNVFAEVFLGDIIII